MKLEGRAKRHKRVRKKVIGTVQRPRLSVFRSLKHIYVQLVDDENKANERGCWVAGVYGFWRFVWSY